MMRVVAIYGLMVVVLAGIFGVVRSGGPMEMRIAFGADGNVYRMNGDGSDLKVVADGYEAFDLFWSADGEWIGFIEYSRVYRVGVDGGTIEEVDMPSRFEEILTMDYSPNGRWMVFSARKQGELFEIYRMRVDGSHVEQLTLTSQDTYDAHYSPDGRWIVFEDGSPHAKGYLYRMRADGATIELIQALPFDARSPDWSPDGKWIVFLGSPDTVFQSHIFRMRVDGSGMQQVTMGTGSYYYPHWSPDGEWIVTVGQRGSSYDVYRIRPDGSEEELLFKTMNFGDSPQWSPIVDMAWDGWKVGGLGVGLVVLGAVVVNWRRRGVDY